MLKILILILVLSFLAPNPAFSKNTVRIRESTIIYKLKENAKPEEIKKFNALINQTNIIFKKELKGVKINVVKLRNIKGLEKAFSKKLMDTRVVKFAHPDSSVPPNSAPNDPYFLSQWHHEVIVSPGAWDYNHGSASVKVCILDTGVDTDHPDLVGNLLTGYNTACCLDDGSKRNPNYHTNYVEAVHGHGTATTGALGAVGNNATGVAGIAWNIGIVPVKINFNEEKGYAYVSDMIEGIEWCADQGVKVANLSYSGAGYPGIAEAAQYLRDKGGLLFLGAGNEGTFHDSDHYPDYSSFVVVGATDELDNLTFFSNYGPFVDIVAPGQSILTTSLGGDYTYYSGTSLSAPLAAGLASLIYSNNPDLTPLEVENIIFNTAFDLGEIGDDDVYGHGIIDAEAAVIAAMPTDIDNDGIPNDQDNCPLVSNPDQSDTDIDGIGDACDACPDDSANDADIDGVCGDVDNCPAVNNVNQADGDSDGVGDACDACPADILKTDPGICGCSVADTDSDGDGTADCNDLCPSDPNKTVPEQCGCGNPETDTDSDGIADCVDSCTNHPDNVCLEDYFEGFESGDFSLDLPWNKKRIDWFVQDSIVHNGNYALQSPLVEDGKSAHLYLTLCIEEEMDISFWFKVSSEVDFDYLVFKIDGVEVGRWSGEIDWTEVSYPVNAGEHRFLWSNIKDKSKSQGDDAAWIDDIVFPQSTTCEPCEFFVIPNQNGGAAVICL